MGYSRVPKLLDPVPRDAGMAGDSGFLAWGTRFGAGTQGRTPRKSRPGLTSIYPEKLYSFVERLEPVVGNDFPRLFPAPSKKELVAEQVGQLALF
jgi:hypothetical protein